MHRFSCLLLWLVALPAPAVDIEWVYVGDPGNPPDIATNCVPKEPSALGASDCGSVSDPYWISKFEITMGQYVEFLNAKAASDPLGLYDERMNIVVHWRMGCGIQQTGSPGGYAYALECEGNPLALPIDYISYWNALRFANWLHNGKGDGDTQTGAYTLAGNTPVPSNWEFIPRNPHARVFLPDENEWFKAAYYDPTISAYHDFPAGSGEFWCSDLFAEENQGNCAVAVLNTFGHFLSPVGIYLNATSPYGTYDQGGNVHEWIEMTANGTLCHRGQSAGQEQNGRLDYGAADWFQCRPVYHWTIESALGAHGFRVATVPESTHALLVLAGGLVLAAARGWRAS